MKTQTPTQKPILTFWRALFFAIMLAGAYATYVRFARGLGASTNLSDRFPWGIWIGFDVLIGVGLAAGGFTVSAVVHVFHMKKYEPMARPAVLTAFLGYQLVSVALTFDIGQPWRIWHPMVMWNPHSVMFEVAWCVMLYTTVLAIEFSPVVFERLGWQRPLRLVRALYTPFVILGVLLSMMHQSSLGTVFLIMPGKLHGLWYTPWLPVFFFLTAVTAGLAMTIVESNLSRRAFGHHLEHHLDDSLLQGMSRAIAVALAAYALWKMEDLFVRGNLGLVFQFSRESVMFWGEMLLGVALPILLFVIPPLRRNRQSVFLGAILTVLGFMLNRLNVSVTGMAGASGAHYFPSWMELAVSAAMVAAGCAGFALAVKYLNVFSHGPAPSVEAIRLAVVPAPLVNGSGLATLWSLLAVGAVLLLLAPPSRAQSGGQASVPSSGNTVPAPAKPSSDLNLPEAFTFPRSEGSPGDVTFTHETHVPRMDGDGALCAACHRSEFSIRAHGKALHGDMTMERMRQGQLCGSCHNGTKAFALDDCTSCHP